MANNNNATVNKANVSVPQKQKSEPKVAKNEPTYTVEEFAAAPQSVGTESPDIVIAALSVEGKTSYTVSEAEEIVKKFKKKEVK
jgi:hypothetical protein